MSVRGRPKGKRRPGPTMSFEPLLVHGVDVERRIGEDEVEPAGGVVRVVVVAVDLPPWRMSPSRPCTARFMRQRRPVSSTFSDAVDGQLRGGVLLVLGDEARALHEHAARAAGGVEDAPVERLDDLDEQPDDAGRRVELAALLALGAWRTRRGSIRRSGRRRRLRAAGNLGDLLEQFLEEAGVENL